MLGDSENYLEPVRLSLQAVKGLEFNIYNDKRIEDTDDNLGPAFDGIQREFKF